MWDSINLAKIKPILFIVACLTASWVLHPGLAQAQTAVEIGCDNGVGNVADLINNLNLANEDPDQETLILGENCVYLLTTPTTVDKSGLLISADLVIEGNGATIRRKSSPLPPHFRLIKISGGAEVFLKDLILMNGHIVTGGGGAILAEQGSTVRLDEVQLRNNTAKFGGAIATLGGTTIVSGSLLDNNQALGGGGGGIYTNSALTVSDGTTFTRNTARRDGGAIAIDDRAVAEIAQSKFEQNQSLTEEGGGVYTSGPLTVINSDFLTNTAQLSGGGLYGEDEINVSGSRFEHNQATLEDGGGLVAGTGSSLTLSEVAFNDNQARTGGGLVSLGPVTISGGQFDKNKATIGAGGAMYALNRVEVDGTGFTFNKAQLNGGSLFIGGNRGASLKDVTISHNESLDEYGGGIYARTALTVTTSYFAHNKAVYGGGGIFVDLAPAEITDTHFEQNLASFANGGGILATGSLTVAHSQFIRNTSVGSGGGIYSMTGPTKITNSTFERNSILSDGGGAAVFSGTLEFRGNTLVSNNAERDGAGLWLRATTNDSQIVNNLWIDNQLLPGNEESGVISVFGEIPNMEILIAHNTLTARTPVIERGIVSRNTSVRIINNIITHYFTFIHHPENSQGEILDNNVLFDFPGMSEGEEDDGEIVADPHFVDPTTNDFRLQADSPAIDSGLDVGVSVDLDGRPRPVGEGFDVGAYEFEPQPDPEPDPEPQPGGGFTFYLPLVVK